MPTPLTHDLLVCHLAACGQTSFHNSGDLNEPQAKLAEARLTAEHSDLWGWREGAFPLQAKTIVEQK